MTLTLSPELDAVYSRARALSESSFEPLTSAHLLLAFFDVPNYAARYLEDREITADRLLLHLQEACEESSDVFDGIVERSRRLARCAKADHVTSLHLLLAMLKETGGIAYRAIDRTGVTLSHLRNEIMSYASGSRALPRKYREIELVGGDTGRPASEAPSRAPERREDAPSPIQFHPSLTNRSLPVVAREDTRREERSRRAFEATITTPPIVSEETPHSLDSAPPEPGADRVGSRSIFGALDGVHPMLGARILYERSPGDEERAEASEQPSAERGPDSSRESGVPDEDDRRPQNLPPFLERSAPSKRPEGGSRDDGSSDADRRDREEGQLRSRGRRNWMRRREEARRRADLTNDPRITRRRPRRDRSRPDARRSDSASADADRPVPDEVERDAGRPAPPSSAEEPVGDSNVPDEADEPRPRTSSFFDRNAPASTPPPEGEGTGPRDDSAAGGASGDEVEPRASDAERGPSSTEEPDEDTDRTAEAADPGERAPRSRETDDDDTPSPDVRQEALADARSTSASLAERIFGAAGEEDEAHSDGGTEDRDERPVDDRELAERYRLDAEQFPQLCKHGRNLSVEAALGEIDAVIGRESEINQLIDIVGKRRSNNPMLIGDPGVGKTAIVEGLACAFADMAREGHRIGARTIIELEIGRLLSGTQLRGSFSERLIAIKDEVKRAEGRVIVFLDEIHMWIGAGNSGDGGDAANELKTALARGQFPCIGATTADEFRSFVENDPAFERRFQVVFVEEPDLECAEQITRGISSYYARHHGVEYSEEAVVSAVRLSHRYIHKRRLPDKAIGVLDLAGSRAARTGRASVDRAAVAEVVAEMAGIPAGRLDQSDSQRFLSLEEELGRRVVGHRHVIDAVAEVLRRNYAGFRSHRPIGSLLFLGPTGVGKTELVKALADFLFHDREAIVRLDMSEFMEKHSVSRFIGAPPGYVGYDQGGQLTEAIRQRPYQIVLLDEIEKAHPDILNLLLQLFDEGRLTDGCGRVVDFSNTVVIMTSNLGAETFYEQIPDEMHTPIGFRGGSHDGAGPSLGDRRALVDRVLQRASEHFPMELWGRIDERLVFMPLSRDEIAEIARLQLEDSSRRLQGECEITLRYEEEVVEYLIDHGGYNRQLGARPMRQTIQRQIESAVARLILGREVRRGETVLVRVRDEEIDLVAGAPEKDTTSVD